MSGELFIKYLGELLVEGEEIDSLVLKDLEFFKMISNYSGFPELLDSLKSQQLSVEVYEPNVPDDGMSFMNKTPYLTTELI